MRIGVDFDNTLVQYDQVFSRLAAEAGLAPTGAALAQKAVRDLARGGPGGDLAWQALQGQAYGPRLGEAEPAPGALAFLRRCAERGIPVRIVSHKTEFAAVDPSRTPLREAALAWLRAHGAFAPGTGLEPGDVRFAATRAEKVAMIREEGLTHFVDDLAETFLEPGFPPGTQAVLYAPAGDPAPPPGARLVRSWQELDGVLFHG
jgi:hypothetical protein